MSKDHLAKAREYIGKGEGFYRKAAEEIVAAMQADPKLSYREVDRRLGRGQDYARKLVSGVLSADPERQAAPFGGEAFREARERSSARKVLREAPPEQIAKLLDEPRIRANVSKAQTIAAEETVRKSREAQREAIGPETTDKLAEQQRYHDAEAELFKARRGLIETLRILNDGGIADMRDSWREEFLLTLDDITAKADLARAFLTGSLDEELEKLLEA